MKEKKNREFIIMSSLKHKRSGTTNDSSRFRFTIFQNQLTKPEPDSIPLKIK